MDIQAGEIIAIDKPYRMSSFGALAHVRFLLCRKLGVRRVKIGHAGTLDPLATGVLLLCTGRATKRIEEFQGLTKEYTATLQLGATTVSYDMEHPENATFETAHITRSLIDHTLPRFVGQIEQVPPAYSACKVDGKPAYLRMRKGQQVEMRAKQVRIDEIEVTCFDPDTMRLSLRVVCGKGTYIRSLARDIGEALGSGAYLTALRRTRVGDYRVEDSVSFDHFKEWLDRQDIACITPGNHSQAADETNQ